MTFRGTWPPLFVGLFAPGKQSKEFRTVSSILRGLFRGRELLNSQLHFWGIIIWLQNQPLLEQLSGSARSLSFPSVQPGLQRFLRAANIENYLTKRDGRQLCTALFAQKLQSLCTQDAKTNRKDNTDRGVLLCSVPTPGNAQPWAAHTQILCVCTPKTHWWWQANAARGAQNLRFGAEWLGSDLLCSKRFKAWDSKTPSGVSTRCLSVKMNACQ